MAKLVANGLAFPVTSPLPAASSCTGWVLLGPNGVLYFSNGVSWQSLNTPLPSAALVASSAAISTTETYVTPAFQMPANWLLPGTKFRITLYGNFTNTSATTAQTSTITCRFGTAGTVADAAVATITATAPMATSTAAPFKVEFLVTVRTTGSSGTVVSSGMAWNSGTANGISAANIGSPAPSAVALNTTTALYLGVSVKTGATTGTLTITEALVELA